MSIYRAPFPRYAIILTGPIGLVKNGSVKLEYAPNQETAENIAFCTYYLDRFYGFYF